MTLVPSDRHITYLLQYRTCGKAGCRTCQQGPGHGPYWYAYWREQQRVRSGYVGKTLPAGRSPAPSQSTHPDLPGEGDRRFAREESARP
ncbi:MAG TPA: DUF6788 family protein [Ktedonobacterales bacterium]|nr:DUF6788 family protein [Ktedonobacterales bacterium]